MRLGVAWTPGQNAQYRAFQPMRAMERRGHQVIWPPSENGEAELRRLSGCDVVHVFRRSDPATRRVLGAVMQEGTAITFDNDDDFTALPKELRATMPGMDEMWASTVQVARNARVFTTTSEVLEARYRRAGVERIEVIGNYLVPDVERPRVPHDGVVIGWVAGKEHRVDAKRLKIADALRQLLAKHPHVRVECIGVDLHLRDRYRWNRHVPFEAIPGRIAGFDVGIAPLADLPFNVARSDIKLKEYAASGVPWLASPVGPYAGYGEAQGGRLVRDGEWFDALERLVTNPGEREELGRNAQAWARTQTMEAAAERWEEVFLRAAGDGATRPRQPRPRFVVRMAAPGTPRPR